MNEGRNRFRLSMMMALIYASQGAFWPWLSLHLGDLGFTGRERGWIFSTCPLATIFMSLGAGSLVDRLMPSQRYLSICYGIGTLFLWGWAVGLVSGVVAMWLSFLLYWLVTAPTFGIGNSIAFRNLRDPDADFGRVRMWGTIGWMLIGWSVTAVMLFSGSTKSGRGAYETFWIGAGFSAILAVFALTLPNTPPLAVSSRVSSFGAARELLRQPGVRAYLLIAFAVHMTTPFVFQTMPPYLESIGMPRAWAATVLTIGQWPEIAALAGLPWLLRRYGYKITLGVGIVAWLIRFATLAADPPLWLAVAGIPLHGIGIACFTVGGQVFLDSRASSDRRAGAQALNMMTTSGLGSFAGSLMAGNLIGYCEGNYAGVFLVPCLIHVGLIGLFLIGFHPDGGVASRLADAVPSPARPVPRDRSRRIVAGVGPLAMESADG